MKVLYFDCFAGAAGDMVLGALIDAGVKLEDVRRALGSLAISPATVWTERVTRTGIAPRSSASEASTRRWTTRTITAATTGTIMAITTTATVMCIPSRTRKSITRCTGPWPTSTV